MSDSEDIICLIEILSKTLTQRITAVVNR